MSDKKNKKVPESDANWEYPWNQVIQTLGGHEIFLNSTPDEECTRIQHPSGTYEENTKDGHQVKLVANQKNSLVSNGASDTIEGALDRMVVGGMRGVNLGGLQTEIAKHMSQAIYGQFLNVAKNMITTYTEDEHHEASHRGKVTSHADGFSYLNTKQDVMDATTGNRILGASKDLMVFSEQNADIFANEKLRLASTGDMKVTSNATMNTFSQQDMTIQSKSKITLKVGDNASIIITDGQIEIKATTIKLTATGELSANGHPLKINGGGPTSTPTQWP